MLGMLVFRVLLDAVLRTTRVIRMLRIIKVLVRCRTSLEWYSSSLRIIPRQPWDCRTANKYRMNIGQRTFFAIHDSRVLD